MGAFMQSASVVKVWLGGAFGLLALIWFLGPAASADDSYSPAPPVAVQVQPGHERHGLLIAQRNPRTRLVDGSGLSLWNDPSCSHAPRIDVWRVGADRAAVIDTPAWVKLPVRMDERLALGVVPGIRIHFEAPVAKTARVREIVQADPSVAFAWFCVYEEFYRTPGDPAAGGEAFWSRIEVEPPNPAHDYFAKPGYTPRQPPTIVDNTGWPTPVPTATPKFVGSPSFFPPRPPLAEIRYRTGVLIEFGAGMHSGWTAIKDAAGNRYGYYIGWPMYIDGTQTHCAFPPRPGVRFDPTLCDGGWPADMVIGTTRVRVYFWHDVTPWGQRVVVTDQIIKAP